MKVIVVEDALKVAVRFPSSPRGPDGRQVAIEIAPCAGCVTVAVSDEGLGILPGEREKIFEPFFRGRGETERSSDGAGLGLAIVRQIARAHGGDVALVDSGGKETRFEVTLRHGADAARAL